MGNKCIKQHMPELDARHDELVNNGMSDRGAAIQIAVEQYESIFNELNKIKKQLGINISEYTVPSMLNDIKRIEDEYNSKIKNIEDIELREYTLSDRERSDVIEQMTYMFLKTLVDKDENIFNVTEIEKKKSEIYPELKSDIFTRLGVLKDTYKNLRKEGKITKEEHKRRNAKINGLIININDNWDTITDSFEEYLKRFNIEFDENDHIQLNDLDKSRDEGFGDSRKIDAFRKANSAIKLLLSAIPRTTIGKDGKETAIRTSINGVRLIPSSQVTISLWNKLSHAVNIDDMMERLRQMATDDSDYRALYKRLMKTSYDSPGNHSFEKINSTNASQLINAFWNTFKKQNPSVQNIFVLDNGDIVTGEAALSTAAMQFRNSWKNSIIEKAKDIKNPNRFFKWDSKKKRFVGDPSTMRTVRIDSPAAMMSFLDKLGINFSAKELNYLRKYHKRVYKSFEEAVGGIRLSIINAEEIVSFSGKVLDIENRLLELGLAKSIANNPALDSTFFNIVGERMQSYIGPNAASDLYHALSKVKNINELKGTQYEYLVNAFWNTIKEGEERLLSDTFAEGSNILRRMFDDNGNKRDTGNELLETGYAGGIMYSKTGKSKESSRLTYMERLIQELNLNLKGWYLNLVPGDANIEWMVYMGNPISVKSLRKGMDDVHTVFRRYFISEFNTAKDDARNVDKKRKDDAGELRFFKKILPVSLYNKVMEKEDGRDAYETNKDAINKAVDDYIKRNTSKTRKVLEYMGVLQEDEKGFTFKNVALPSHMKEDEVMVQLMALTINYMIANTEMHKILYSDPYQYNDELKRIKNFLSPRQSLMAGSETMNKVLHKVWNKGFSKKDIGYTNFLRDYFRTATYADVIGVSDLPGYDPYDETDGSGIITFRAYRQFRIRVGNWNDKEEAQYRYDIAWEKSNKGIKLTDNEQAILDKGNPKIQSAYTPLKPIVSGNKANNQGYNDTVLDKYALYPLSYRVMNDINVNGGKTTSNALALYDKMQKDDIDYVIFASARKVGAEETNTVYDREGKFNEADYKGIINIPFSIMSLQTEVPAKEGDKVTRGSQVTKLITMDFMEAGVPIDFLSNESWEDRYAKWRALDSDKKREEASPLFKEIKNNQAILEALMEDGYVTLLNKLGIKETTNKKGEKEYTLLNKDGVPDFTKVTATLKDEMLKREVNDNLIAAINSFGNENSLLESTPAYQQVRNILYSIVDKLIVSPKMTGGLKVQIPATFLEEHKDITPIKGKKGYQSDTLRFYSRTEDGKTVNVCQLMLPRWFKSNKSDKELLDYLNNSEEGKKILRGIAFRIPTQKQNSIDVFEIKQFLPREFGDSVVVPSAIVRRSGADFDIDKLSIYLKNVLVDTDGAIVAIPFRGIGEDARMQMRMHAADYLNRKIAILEKTLEKTEKRESFFIELYSGLVSEKTYNKWVPIFKEWYADQLVDGKLPVRVISEFLMDKIEGLGKKIEHLTDDDVNTIMTNELGDRWYRESLENAYMDSSDALISHPLNYEQLIKPNNATQLHNLADEVATAIHGEIFKYDEVSNMLDRTFMSRLRHAFVTGRQAIAIAAVGQTNHSLNQRQTIVIDPSLIGRVPFEDRQWLGDGEVKFSNMNRIKVGDRMLPTLSKIKNAVGHHISDIISQFIDGYVDISKGPWIMELGASPNVAPTFLFLVKLGVPIRDIAFFMNQPLIRHYLKTLESNGYVWLFNSTIVESVKSEYASEEEINRSEKEIKDFVIPSSSALKELVGKPLDKLSKQQMQDQMKMLDEFLKYAKMATHLFYVTQATNYDTATFNDPLLIWKKEEQMKRANKTLISDAQSILDNSFIGHIPKMLRNARNAISNILISDQEKVRSILHKTLLPYIDERDDDFLKIARKATADLFDFAVQTDQKFNQDIKELFAGGTVTKIIDFVNEVRNDKGHPLHGNVIIEILQLIPSPKGTKNSVNNIRIRGIDNNVYDQNNIIYAFREIRNELGANSEIYKGLINIAILQSGLSPSNISYTSLIPFEDFARIYNKTLSKLASVDLSAFNRLGVFYKNNWNNDDIVTRLAAFWVNIKGRESKVYNISMEFLSNPVKDAVKKREIPPVITLPSGNKEAQQEYIFYTWNAMEELLTEKDWNEVGNNLYKRRQRIFSIQEKMRNEGDFSYMRKALFKRVVDEQGAPAFRTYKDKDYIIYKAVNAWGEGTKANEFYTIEQESVIDNGLEKVPDVSDSEIIAKFAEPDVKKSKPRAGGYMSPEADYEAEKNSPVGKMLREKESLPNKVVEGDIFSMKGIPVITTNLGGVHGAGLAQQAKNKGLIKQGEGQFKVTDKAVSLPVKKVWSDSMAMNKNMDLLKDGLRKLILLARSKPNNTYLLPLAGLGHGEGKIEEILPLLIKTINSVDNIKLVLPKEGMSLGRQGTVRKDNTLSNLSKIKEMLRKELSPKQKDNTNAPNGKPDIGRTSLKC